MRIRSVTRIPYNLRYIETIPVCIRYKTEVRCALGDYRVVRILGLACVCDGGEDRDAMVLEIDVLRL